MEKSSDGGQPLHDNDFFYTGPPFMPTNTLVDVPLETSLFYDNEPFDGNIWYDAGPSTKSLPNRLVSRIVPSICNT
jgi:hypothetical protein